MQDDTGQFHRPRVVDMPVGDSTLVPVLRSIFPRPDAFLRLKAKTREQARGYVPAALEPNDIKPGTINALRAQRSGRWWIFGVML